MTKTSKIAFLIVFLSLVVPLSNAFPETEILSIRRWTAPDHTRIVIDVSAAVQYKATEETQKLSIALSNTSFPTKLPHQYFINKPAVKKILLIPLPGKKVGVELHLGENAKVKIFELGPIKNRKPHRVVIDVILPEVQKKESEERKQVKIQEKIQEKRKIVVIDAGHGGEDPGAVGRRKTKEKDVVLKIAKRLRRILREKGYQAYLTREGDYYISFKKRLNIAREYGADLFVSIHTDAHKLKGARGTSVYCLSTKGASSEAAKLLARNENLSDIIAGVANGENNGESNPITLNMLQTETINQSKFFGSTMLQGLGKVNHIKYTKVHGAPFRILKLPEIPSILVEVAYISNPREEVLLRQASFRNNVAWAIASSIEKFLPLPPTLLVKGNDPAKSLQSDFDGAEKPAVYIVKKGDTLETIAAQYDTTVQSLLGMNNLKNKNRICVGQKLKISPVSSPSVPESMPTATYVVKRGDILDRIAQKHDTTIDVLLGLNNLRSPDRIFVGQKLKIPSDGDGSEALSTKEKKMGVYVVRRGDILDRIALKHDTTAATLMRINNLESKNRIYVGQQLKVPSGMDESKISGTTKEKVSEIMAEPDDAIGKIVEKDAVLLPRLADTDVSDKGDSVQITESQRVPSEDENEKDPAVETIVYATYVVKIGDNLDRIAMKHNTKTAELMALNNIRSKDIIYVNQVLKVPSTVATFEDSPKGETLSDIYIVRKGDTLEKIATEYNTTIQTLLKMNDLKRKNFIYVKQKLKVPLPVDTKRKYFIYIVKRGDILERIAGRHKTTVGTLRELNRLKSKNHIYVGQKLKVPSYN